MIFNQICFSHKAKLFLGYSSQSRDDEKKVLFKMPATSKHHDVYVHPEVYEKIEKATRTSK